MSSRSEEEWSEEDGKYEGQGSLDVDASEVGGSDFETEMHTTGRIRLKHDLSFESASPVQL